MPRGRDPQEFLEDILVPDDGLLAREARAHSRDKLGILRYYLPGFTRACVRWPGTYFVDACAGPGLYSFNDMEECALGSTLIALGTGDGANRQTELPFTRVLSMDLDPECVDALRHRVAGYGERSIVEEGDCNRDLLPLLREQVPTGQPLLVFFDPQAFEVEWTLVEETSRFRGDQPTEMLLLVNPTAALRVLGVGGEATDRLRRTFPPGSDLDAIAEERHAGLIQAPTAKRRIVQSFVEGLRGLGYRDPVARAITHPGPDPYVEGGEVYHLVFASASPAGDKIMSAAFNKIYTNQPDSINTGQLEMDLGIVRPPLRRLPGAIRFKRDERDV